MLEFLSGLVLGFVIGFVGTRVLYRHYLREVKTKLQEISTMIELAREMEKPL